MAALAKSLLFAVILLSANALPTADEILKAVANSGVDCSMTEPDESFDNGLISLVSTVSQVRTRAAIAEAVFNIANCIKAQIDAYTDPKQKASIINRLSYASSTLTQGYAKHFLPWASDATDPSENDIIEITCVETHAQQDALIRGDYRFILNVERGPCVQRHVTSFYAFVAIGILSSVIATLAKTAEGFAAAVSEAMQKVPLVYTCIRIAVGNPTVLADQAKKACIKKSTDAKFERKAFDTTAEAEVSIKANADWMLEGIKYAHGEDIATFLPN